MIAARAAAEQAGQSQGRASSNAEFGIVMRLEAPGKCRIEVTRDTETAWTLPRCLGTQDDIYFGFITRPMNTLRLPIRE